MANDNGRGFVEYRPIAIGGSEPQHAIYAMGDALYIASPKFIKHAPKSVSGASETAPFLQQQRQLQHLRSFKDPLSLKGKET